MSLTEWACNADTNIPNDNSRPGWATHYSGLGSTQSTSPFEAFLGAANPQMTAVHAASRRDASMITSSAAMLTSQGSSVPACAGWKVCTPWPPTGSCCKREESRRSPRSFRGCARRRTDLLPGGRGGDEETGRRIVHRGRRRAAGTRATPAWAKALRRSTSSPCRNWALPSHRSGPTTPDALTRRMPTRRLPEYSRMI